MEWTTESIPRSICTRSFLFFPVWNHVLPRQPCSSSSSLSLHLKIVTRALLSPSMSLWSTDISETLQEGYPSKFKKKPKPQNRSSLGYIFQFCSFFFFHSFFQQENAIANKSISLTSTAATQPGSPLILIFHIKILLNLKWWKSTFTPELWHSMKLNLSSRTFIHCIKPAFMGCSAESSAFKWPYRSLCLHQLWKGYSKTWYSEGKITFWKAVSSTSPFPFPFFSSIKKMFCF